LIPDARNPAGLRPRRRFLFAFLLLGALSARAGAGDVVLPAVPAPPAWRAVFSYCQEGEARFDETGEPVWVRSPVAPLPPPDPSAPPFDPDGEAARAASGGDPARAAAFLAWLEGESSEPGETVLVAGTEPGAVYVLSEHGAAVRSLKRFDMATGRAACLTPPDGPRELVSPEFAPGADGGLRPAGLAWRSPEGTFVEWRDPAMASLQSRLEEAFPAAGFDWLALSSDGVRRIVRVRFPDRPAAWLCADAATASWTVLATCPVAVSPTRRTLFRWTASDGEALCGVFTRPDAPGPFPLVVFPHGGPGAISTTAFDERVWALADAGFAVFQPNYRGSAGFGKAFRLAGWGAEGIRRGLLDVREGVSALLSDPACRLDGSPPVLLGGSWGGFVAVAELAEFSGIFAGAVSFFGAFDLPELVRSEWERIAREEGTPAAVARSRRSLARQFADPAAAAAMAALAEASPARRAASILEPVVLFHNRSDKVIPFSQSERMHEALAACGGRVLFRPGEGEHGWTPEEEADLYASLAVLFRSWMSEGE